MPTNRVRRKGSYAPLSSRYYMDDAIMRAGERSETLFTRGLAFSAETRLDGFISDLQVTNVIGIGMKDALARAERLCAEGLWLPDGERRGFIVRSWLGWNQSSSEIQDRMEADNRRKGRV